MKELLRKVPCFAELEEGSLALLEEMLERVSFNKDEVLCSEGEVGDRMFIIMSGRVAVLKKADGSSVQVAELKEGNIAGEMGLFGQKKRTATLKALSPCDACVLSYDSFNGFLDKHGSVARGMLDYLSQHLARETSIAARLMAKDGEKGLRVAFFHATPYRNELYTKKNKYNYTLHFFASRLTLETVPLAAGFRVIVVSANDCLDAEVLSHLHNLGVELIALRCAGFNNVDLTACAELGFSIARVPAYSPNAVAEHAVALMMALNRKTHRAHNRVREGNFSLDGLVGFDLCGKTAAVIGTGKIGACTLRILHGFGCRLLAHDLYPNGKLAEELNLSYLPLEEIFPQSDIISLHAPLTEESHHLINRESVAMMKPGVMLINTARGALIDSTALIEGLKDGHIGYAGLDVYEEEGAYFFEDFSNKVITDDVLARLTTFNNVMITGHQGSLTRDAQENIVETTLANIREFELGKRGKEMTNSVLPS